jgi:hypothetical protein
VSRLDGLMREPVTLSVIASHDWRSPQLVYRVALVTRGGRVLHCIDSISRVDAVRLARRYAERAGMTVVREVVA